MFQVVFIWNIVMFQCSNVPAIKGARLLFLESQKVARSFLVCPKHKSDWNIWNIGTKPYSIQSVPRTLAHFFGTLPSELEHYKCSDQPCASRYLSHWHRFVPCPLVCVRMILDRYGGDKAELSSLCNILIDPVLHATKVTGIFFSKHTNDIVAAHKMGAKKTTPKGGLVSILRVITQIAF